MKKPLLLLFPRQPASGRPACSRQAYAGVTLERTFYDFIKFLLVKANDGSVIGDERGS